MILTVIGSLFASKGEAADVPLWRQGLAKAAVQLEQSEERKAARLDDREWRLRNLYFIIDKSGQKVLFAPNWAQEEVLFDFHPLKLVLKCRQIGLTTSECIEELDAALFTPNYRVGITAHNLDEAKDFFENKIKFAYDNLPEWLRQEKRGRTDTAQKLSFSNGSSIRVSTSLRSGTTQKFHLSEHGKICAKYPEKAKEIKAGSFNTVHVGQKITIESTAEGRGGDFYRLCCEAVKKMDAGKALGPLDFKFFFFPWWREPGYVMDPQYVEISMEMSAYFAELAKVGISLSAKQKAWYAGKAKLLSDAMKSEYPSTWQEAFAYSGNSVFPAKRLEAMERRTKSPIARGTLRQAGEKITFVEDPDGWLEIWEHPILTAHYVCGADISEGKQIDGQPNGDTNSGHVLKRGLVPVQAARFSPFCDPDEMGERMVLVAKYYGGNVPIAPERNSLGIATVIAIKRTEYEHVFMMPTADDSGKVTKKMGWITTNSSRPELVNDLVAAVRDGALAVNSAETVKQMCSFVRDESGKPQALQGELDDDVLGLGITYQLIKRTEPIPSTKGGSALEKLLAKKGKTPWDG